MGRSWLRKRVLEVLKADIVDSRLTQLKVCESCVRKDHASHFYVNGDLSYDEVEDLRVMAMMWG